MVETAGLENRYTGNGIEGSNPSLSAPPTARPGIRVAPFGYHPVMIATILLAQVGTATAADCALTGLCGLVEADRTVLPGIMFVAVGLVALGVAGLLTARQRRRSRVD